jgi:hypothetical protein
MLIFFYTFFLKTSASNPPMAGFQGMSILITTEPLWRFKPIDFCEHSAKFSKMIAVWHCLYCLNSIKTFCPSQEKAYLKAQE